MTGQWERANVDAGGQIEPCQVLNRLAARIDNVDQALVCTHLKLLATVLVNKGRAHDGELLNTRRQRHGANYLGACLLCRIDDLTHRCVEHTMVVRLELDADPLLCHRDCLSQLAGRILPVEPLPCCLGRCPLVKARGACK